VAQNVFLHGPLQVTAKVQFAALGFELIGPAQYVCKSLVSTLRVPDDAKGLCSARQGKVGPGKENIITSCC
jgi:hypothetical protein